MATLYVTEYAQLNHGIPQEPPTAEQAFTFTTTTQSSAFQSNTNFVRLHTDAICSVEFGANPTATTSKSRMAASTERVVGVVPGWKVAVVSNT